MRQARDIGMTAQFYTTTTVMSPSFIEAAGNAVDGTIFSVFTPSNPERYDSFISDFKARYGERPVLDISTVPSYDAVNIIIEFAKTYEGDFESRDFARALKDHFYQLENYEGASGTITISEDGATRSLSLRSYEVQEGARILR